MRLLHDMFQAASPSYKRKALKALENAQLKLVEEELNKAFAEHMIAYYKAVIVKTKTVLATDNSWEGYAVHTDKTGGQKSEDQCT